MIGRACVSSVTRADRTLRARPKSRHAPLNNRPRNRICRARCRDRRARVSRPPGPACKNPSAASRPPPTTRCAWSPRALPLPETASRARTRETRDGRWRSRSSARWVSPSRATRTRRPARRSPSAPAGTRASGWALPIPCSSPRTAAAAGARGRSTAQTAPSARRITRVGYVLALACASPAPRSARPPPSSPPRPRPVPTRVPHVRACDRGVSLPPRDARLTSLIPRLARRSPRSCVTFAWSAAITARPPGPARRPVRSPPPRPPGAARSRPARARAPDSVGANRRRGPDPRQDRLRRLFHGVLLLRRRVLRRRRGRRREEGGEGGAQSGAPRRAATRRRRGPTQEATHPRGTTRATGGAESGEGGEKSPRVGKSRR